MTIADLDSTQVDALVALFQRLPERDLTFIKADVSPEAVAQWPTREGARWVEVADDGTVTGVAALLPLTGWSDHVGELRLIVDPAVRGHGIGEALTRHAVKEALRLGLVKVVVELPAVQERTIEMFLRLGFTGEAILRDHFRDRSGQLQDLIMLAFLADETLDAVSAVGVPQLLEGQ